MENKKDFKFGKFLNFLRVSRGFSMRDLGFVLDISASYINDLEKGNRKPTLNLMKKVSDNLVLSDDEKKEMLDAFTYDRLQVPPDLIRYLVDNELIDTINTLREYDSDGTKVKTFTLSLKNNSNKN